MAWYKSYIKLLWNNERRIIELIFMGIKCHSPFSDHRALLTLLYMFERKRKQTPPVFCFHKGGRGGLWWRSSQTAKPQAAGSLAQVSQVCVLRRVAAAAFVRNVRNASGVPAGGGQESPATDRHHGNITRSFQVWILHVALTALQCDI